jgi:hypothetical protein
LTTFPDPSNGVTEAMVTPAGSGFGNPICSPVEGQSPRLSRILTDLTDALVLLNEIRAAMANAHPIAIQPIAPSLTAWLANAAAAGLGSTNYSLVQA